MATRRTPLIDNPNAANSPLRSINLNFMKQKRSLASIQREDGSGQQPPLKKQILDANSAQNGLYPSRSSRPPRATSAHALNRRERVLTEAVAQAAVRYSEKEKESILAWQRQTRAKFPNMVFFFEGIQNDIKEKLVKDILKLGAVEAKFFSNDVTHVVTNRPIPAINSQNDSSQAAVSGEYNSSVNFGAEHNTSVNRRLFTDLKPRASRSTDVLVRAQEMGKKVYPVEKLHKILVNLLEVDIFATARTTTRSHAGGANIDHLIESERIARAYGMDKGSNEMNYLRGPYIYVYDMQERYKPIMVREYAHVADKRDGDWPQFRSVANGRCPFVEDAEAQASRELRALKAKEKERELKAQKASMAILAPKLRPSREPSPLRAASKRSRDEAADNLGAADTSYSRVPSATHQISHEVLSTAGKLFENPFTGKAPAGKLLAGEPVASGIQKNAATSAIRSQMISSTSGTLGAKAGTSREMMGLQRKVLRIAGNSTAHQDGSSRRATENSVDGTSSRLASRGVAEIQADENALKERKSSMQKMRLPEKEKRELKPGFCENCQCKFRDFEEHIISDKHRNFANDRRNWEELDSLLSKLDRPSKFEEHESTETGSVF